MATQAGVSRDPTLSPGPPASPRVASNYTWAGEVGGLTGPSVGVESLDKGGRSSRTWVTLGRR